MFSLYRLEDDDACFACGKKNPIGLKLSFALKDGEAVGTFTPEENHQGYKGMMHGGLVATLLDEAMAHYLLLQGIFGVTGRLKLRFQHPVPVGVSLNISAGVEKERRDWILLWGLLEEGGRTLARGEGLFYKMKKEDYGDGTGRGTGPGEKKDQSEESGETLSGR